MQCDSLLSKYIVAVHSKTEMAPGVALVSGRQASGSRSDSATLPVSRAFRGGSE